MSLTLDSLISLYQERGDDWYGGEEVTQRQHALQAAFLAEQSGAPSALVIACLLHDIGHLVHDLGEDAAGHGLNDSHEMRGITALAHLFPPAVLTPIRLHVTAKRHLCQVNSGYFADLSLASRRSLELQGGPLTAEQSDEFLAQSGAQEAISLRQWDDRAKDTSAVTPDFTHYRPLMESLVLKTQSSSFGG